MKKKIGLIFLALLMCLAIFMCGCGREKTVEERIAEFSLPQETAIDASTPVQDWEFILPNGAFFGMDYEMVEFLCGGDVLEFSNDSEEYATFLHGGIFYGFNKDSEGVLRLRSLNIQDSEENYGEYGVLTDEPILRGLGVGDTLEEFFEVIPAEDTTLRQAEWQYVYGPNDDGSCAVLEFIANSYYGMRIESSGNYTMHMSFSRKGHKLLWVEVYDNSFFANSAENDD